jgi:membrane-associated phospholipid phosphatase
VGLRERIAAAAPTRTVVPVLAGLGLALIALTALVWAGSLNRLDQYAVNHFMPWLEPRVSHESSIVGFYRPFGSDAPAWSKVLALWSYPCSILISTLVVIGAGIVLWRRYGPVVAVLPAVAWVIGNAVEVVGKSVITRPPLYLTTHGAPFHVAPFDDSYPSGHMLRGVIVAFTLALVFTRLWKLLALWAILVGPALVIDSAHTITDVVGGALVGLILLVLMLCVVKAETRSPV